MHRPRTKGRRGCRDPGAPLSTDRGGHGQGWGQSCKLPGPAPRCPRTPQNRLDRSRTVLSGDKAHPGYRETRKYQAGQQPRPTAQDTSESPGGGGRIRGWTHASSTPKPLPATCTLSSTHHGCVFNTLSPSYIHEWPSSMDWREYLSENACCLMWENHRTLKLRKVLGHSSWSGKSRTMW